MAKQQATGKKTAPKQQTAFERFVSAESGSLPDISSTNYLMTEPDQVESINNQIDFLRTDNEKRAAAAVEETKRIEKVRKDKLKMQIGWLEDGKKVYDWVQAEKQAQAEIDYRFKNRALIKTGPGGTLTEWTTDQDPSEAAKVIDQEWKSVEEFKKEYEAAKGNSKEIERLRWSLINSGAPPEHVHALLGESQYKIKSLGLEGKAAYLQDNFEPYINKLSAVEFQLEGMPYPMSYAYAVSADATSEEASWACALMNNMLAQYYTAYGIDKIPKRYFRANIADGLFEKAENFHRRNINESIRTGMERAKKQRYLDLNDDIKANGVRAITGPKGFIWFQELQPDGSVDTGKGKFATEEALEWLVDEGYMRGSRLQEIIDEPFEHRDGRDKLTNLEEIDSAMYNRLSKVAARANSDETREEIISARNSANSMINEAQKGWKDIPQTDQVINSKINEIIENTGHILTSSDPVFNTLKANSISNLSTMDAFNELLRQKDLGGPVDGNLLKRMDPNSPEYQKARKIIEAVGSYRLSKTEKDEAMGVINGFINDKTKTYGFRSGAAATMLQRKTSADFDNEYNNHFNSTWNAKMSIQERKNAARVHAEKIVVERLQNGDYDKADPTEKVNVDALKAWQETLRNMSFIKKDKDLKVLTLPKYISASEQTALESGEFNYSFWTALADVSFNGKLTGRQLYDYRFKATEGLREAGSKPIIYEPPVEEGNLEAGTKSNLNNKRKASNVAKLITLPEQKEWMLKALYAPYAKDGVDSANRILVGRSYRQIPLELETKVSETTVGNLQLATAPIEDTRMGIYGLKYEEIESAIDDGVVGTEDVFNQETQDKILMHLIYKKAEEESTKSTWNVGPYRKNWIDDNEEAQYLQILEASGSKEQLVSASSPYNHLAMLAPGVAKAALVDAMMLV